VVYTVNLFVILHSVEQDYMLRGKMYEN